MRVPDRKWRTPAPPSARPRTGERRLRSRNPARAACQTPRLTLYPPATAAQQPQNAFLGVSESERPPGGRSDTVLSACPIDVVLLATDLDASKDFYANKIGLPVLVENPNSVTFTCGGDS